ncbi:MAG: tellurite resistance TerB family protein [Polyangiaceae bacterium]|nr:tellurite resistance TerB family protein [Polyangiaceae bacterium]
MGIQRSLGNVRQTVQNIPAFRALLEQGSEAQADAQAAEQSAAAGRAMWLGALTETAYIIAAADGKMSEGESGEIVEGLVSLTDGAVPADEVVDMLDRVKDAVAEQGQKARFEEIAGIIDDEELRDALYLVACAVAWKDGGIGEKQGLAVRALKDAFGYSEGKHQQLLAAARG